MSCDLAYIPERLHFTEDRPLIDAYAVDDILYRRAKEHEVANPFGAISLVDLSHNIGTNIGYELSKMSDVLFSILEEEKEEVYDQQVVALKIISLNDIGRYDKIFACDRRPELKVRTLLLHDPVCCMYPHAVFSFFVYNEFNEEIEVSYKNWGETLGQKMYKHIRTKLRHELSKMIIREVISQDDFE